MDPREGSRAASDRSANSSFLLAALVKYDVEPFILRWRLKVYRDGLELSLRNPRTDGGQVLIPILKLTYAQCVWRVYKVQFMLNVRTR